jgi:hypothetical protein
MNRSGEVFREVQTVEERLAEMRAEEVLTLAREIFIRGVASLPPDVMTGDALQSYVRISFVRAEAFIGHAEAVVRAAVEASKT